MVQAGIKVYISLVLVVSMIFSFHFEFEGQLIRMIKFLRDRAMFGLWSSKPPLRLSTGIFAIVSHVINFL